MNRLIISIFAVAIFALAAGVVILRTPSPSISAAQTKSGQDTEGLSRAMTFTSPAEPKK